MDYTAVPLKLCHQEIERALSDAAIRQRCAYTNTTIGKAKSTTVNMAELFSKFVWMSSCILKLHMVKKVWKKSQALKPCILS